MTRFPGLDLRARRNHRGESAEGVDRAAEVLDLRPQPQSPYVTPASEPARRETCHRPTNRFALVLKDRISPVLCVIADKTARLARSSLRRAAAEAQRMRHRLSQSARRRS